MATWERENAIVTLINSSSGELETSAKTVRFQPVDQEYPTGVIEATQLSSLSRYIANSDLDTENAYDIYMNGTKIFRKWGPDLMPPIG